MKECWRNSARSKGNWSTRVMMYQSKTYKSDISRPDPPTPSPCFSGVKERRGIVMRMTADKFDRISIDPEQMNGQPCIRGMRLTVRRVLEALALFPDRKDLFAEYPELEEEDLRQALAFAAENMSDSLIIRGQAA
jgi:uncharacterized protein (DUF433 family)